MFSRVKKITRMTALRLLKTLGKFDIHITHPLTGTRFRLHPFKHKGYWFHGKKREAAELGHFRNLIQPGDCVWEIGAHIGFVTQFYSQLVGESGRVVAFEPGPENLKYLRANIATNPNIELQPVAVCEFTGVVTLNVENLSGQNNSLVSNLPVLAANIQNAGIQPQLTQIEVPTVSLDAFRDTETRKPDFIKIDVEGVEARVLKGAQQILLEDRPVLMVELMCDRPKSLELLAAANYRCYYVDGSTVDPHNLPDEPFSNIFAFPAESPRLEKFTGSH
ncbi:MAG: FkbM family methyltransferase [Pirellulaceae bacterium]|nr:FkbM family methyltransferase [Pirellulaceae bacterium]